MSQGQTKAVILSKSILRSQWIHWVSSWQQGWGVTYKSVGGPQIASVLKSPTLHRWWLLRAHLPPQKPHLTVRSDSMCGILLTNWGSTANEVPHLSVFIEELPGCWTSMNEKDECSLCPLPTYICHASVWCSEKGERTSPLLYGGGGVGWKHIMATYSYQFFFSFFLFSIKHG